MSDYGLCECGCGERTTIALATNRSKGWVKGEPKRFIRGHSSRRLDSDVIEDEKGCWNWQFARSDLGYGVMRRTGRNLFAHRAYYEDIIGPIPEGLVIDHLCRNPSCVNPGHLEPVTQRENVLRGDGPTATNARMTHCQNGHPFTAENTWVRPNGHRRCRICKRAAERAARQSVLNGVRGLGA